MAAVGYLCYPPNFQQMINQNRYLPFKDELEHVNPQTLSLYAVLVLLIAMMIKVKTSLKTNSTKTLNFRLTSSA